MITRILTALALACAATAARAAPPVEAYTSLPDFTGARISVDGQRIAGLRPLDGETGIFVYELADMSAPLQVIKAPAGLFISGIQWASPDHLLFEARTNRRVQATSGVVTITDWVLASVDVESGRAYLLLSGADAQPTSLDDVVSTLPDDPEHILVTAWRFNGTGARSFTLLDKSYGHWELGLYRAELDSTRGRRLNIGNRDTTDIVANAAGETIARVEYDPERRLYRIFRGESGQDEVYRLEDADLPDTGVFGALDSDTLAIWARGESGGLELTALHLDTGEREPLAGPPGGGDIDGVLIDSHTDRMVGLFYRDHYRRNYYFDEELAGIQEALDAALPDEHVTLTSWDRDRNRFMVYAEGQGFPGSYSLFDRESGQLEILGFERPMLQPEDVARIEPLEYEARDGLTIPAYVTYPVGKGPEDGPFPTVILPHGGPESRDSARFDWLAQFVASRGYLVLQPNFRGSYGYGAAFRDAGLGEWGGAMIDDIADGLLALVDAGLADPERVCSLGGSYGGFAALSLGFHADAGLECVISINGVTHLPMLVRDTLSDGEDTGTTNYLRLYIGDRYDDEERLRAWSPALRAADYDAEILLIHSEDDTTVPYEHAEAMEGALQRAGAAYTFVRLDGDDHYLATQASRQATAELIAAFLEDKIGGE